MSLFVDKTSFNYGNVHHSKNFVDPETGIHMDNIENLWMLLKQSLRRKFLRSRLNLDLYLAEFCARRKFKNNPIEIF